MANISAATPGTDVIIVPNMLVYITADTPGHSSYYHTQDAGVHQRCNTSGFTLFLYPISVLKLKYFQAIIEDAGVQSCYLWRRRLLLKGHIAATSGVQSCYLRRKLLKS